MDNMPETAFLCEKKKGNEFIRRFFPDKEFVHFSVPLHVLGNARECFPALRADFFRAGYAVRIAYDADGRVTKIDYCKNYGFENMHWRYTHNKNETTINRMYALSVKKEFPCFGG
jgi:hypothetical protein